MSDSGERVAVDLETAAPQLIDRTVDAIEWSPGETYVAIRIGPFTLYADAPTLYTGGEES